MMRTQRVKETFRNLGVLVQGFFSFGLRAHPEISLDNPALLKLPFGVAAAISTLACFCLATVGAYESHSATKPRADLSFRRLTS